MVPLQNITSGSVELTPVTSKSEVGTNDQPTPTNADPERPGGEKVRAVKVLWAAEGFGSSATTQIRKDIREDNRFASEISI